MHLWRWPTDYGHLKALGDCAPPVAASDPSQNPTAAPAASPHGAATAGPSAPAAPATSTVTSSAVASFTHAVTEAGVATVAAVTKTASEADGNQTTSVKTVEELNEIGSSQAATVGALFCAQGANASVQNQEGDAAAYYAGCQQNFGAAKLMKPSGSYSADPGTVEGTLAQQTLSEFEKNFGVPGTDYLKRMLGGGLGALFDVVHLRYSEIRKRWQSAF